jgi:hypothetical protein
MAPTPRVRLNEPLESGQTTILNTLNKGLALQRPPPAPRSGLIPKSSGQSNTVLGRRIIRGANEKQVAQLFASVRLSQHEDREPRDFNIMNNIGVADDLEDLEFEYMPTKRYSYSREHKLVAIDYFQTTWRENKDSTYERLSNRYASRRLRITRKMLRSWVTHKDRIQDQKRGTFRSRRRSVKVKEPELEQQLNAKFEKAREEGRKISYKWMIRHAKQIYEELHPDRVVRYEGSKRSYLGFRFSNGWYRGFRQRYSISLRCSIKRAQKSPEQLEPVLQNWI